MNKAKLSKELKEIAMKYPHMIWTKRVYLDGRFPDLRIVNYGNNNFFVERFGDFTHSIDGWHLDLDYAFVRLNDKLQHYTSNDQALRMAYECFNEMART